MKKLLTQKKLLAVKTTSYRRNKTLNLEILVAKSCEEDRVTYQERVNRHVNFEELFGLKRQLIELSGRVLDATYHDLNSCTWLNACD